MNNFKILTNGLIKENPIFVLLLGMCPTLATTTSAINGLSMGLATMFVLICSNVVISCIKSITPDKVRIPVFIVVIASFVTSCSCASRHTCLMWTRPWDSSYHSSWSTVSSWAGQRRSHARTAPCRACSTA